MHFKAGTTDLPALSKTVDVESEIYLTANYVRTTTSCPLLYAWNGTGYNTVADVNDGTGWLGILNILIQMDPWFSLTTIHMTTLN